MVNISCDVINSHNDAIMNGSYQTVRENYR